MRNAAEGAALSGARTGGDCGRIRALENSIRLDAEGASAFLRARISQAKGQSFLFPVTWGDFAVYSKDALIGVFFSFNFLRR